MGVAISSQSAIAPISLGSTIIGFISFAFTVATFLKVFWASMRTVAAAPEEIEDFLGNLKQGLYEERMHLRLVRRRRRRKSGAPPPPAAPPPRSFSGKYVSDPLYEKEVAQEDLSIKVMRDTLRDVMKKFRALERPFLDDWDRRNRDEKDDGVAAGGGGGGSNGYVDEEVECYSNRYRRCGLPERIAWLRRKTDVLALLDGLARIQTRRIAKEIGDMYFMMSAMDHDIYSTEQKVSGLEDRLSRVVGIRRVN